MNRPNVAFWICWLLAGACPPLLAQQYPFLPVPGSPKNAKVLFQDSRGRLWAGGDQLACFDGVRLFFLRDYGLPAGTINDVSEDSGGSIWIATETGVYRFANGRVEETAKSVAVSVIASTPDLAVAAVGPPGHGIPTNASLVRIRHDLSGWITETIMSLDSPGPLTLDHTGSILYPWPDRGWNEIRLADLPGWHPGAQLPVSHHSGRAPSAGPMKIMRDRAGCIWSGAENEADYLCADGQWHPAEFAGANVRATMQEAPDGSMLLVGYNILAVGRPGSFHVSRPTNGMPALVSAMQARDGTIWLGSMQGLYRFPSPFRLGYWTAREGVDNPWAVQRIGKDVYAGLNGDVAVLSADGARWRSIASFRKTGQVMNLADDGNGNVMVALNPGFAALLAPDGKVLARRVPDGGYGLRFAQTPKHEMWLGGIGLGRLTRHGGLLEFANHRLDTQPAGNVLDVQYEEHSHKLWACYNGGLTERSEDGSWREFTAKDGLLVDACWSLAAMPNGDIWYGYYNTPAFALIRPRASGGFAVRQFRAGDDIADPESLTFDTDHRGWLWRGGNRGLSVADAAAAEAGKWLFLDQSDGLPGVGVNSGSYFADSDGSIWFGIDINVVHYSPPPDLVTPKFAPQVFVSAFSWDNQAPRLVEAVDDKLPHGSKVTAHLGSLQFDRRNALRVRYRLLPEQSEWRETRTLDLPLGTLGSGSHTLQVQGRVFTGPWSSTVSRTFEVLTPLWLAWPLLAAYFVTAASLGAGGYVLRRRRKIEEARVLPDLAAWRLGALLSDVHDVVGTVLESRFEVRALLARGGFASVMAGFDHQQKQPCAIKIFRTEVKDKAWVQRSFDHEVAALRRVRHPNVVSIYAHGRTPTGTPYLVMEFIDGRSLREVLEDGALAPRRAARLLRQLASALDAIHAEGICHRDVKPENVIVRKEKTPEEEAVLIDFSIAIVKDADETLHGLSRAAGTFDYMAPEQAVGYAQTSSDVYSLAKLLIEMLTGRQLKELLPDASLDLPVRVRELARTWTVHLSDDSMDMLSTALEFDPSRRPAVAGEFARPVARDLEPEQPPFDKWSP